MKALSLHQPWASLIAIGAKRVETRHWTTSYRGPLAIHAAATTAGLDGLKDERHGWIGAYCTGRWAEDVRHVADCDCDEDEETVGRACMSNSEHGHALLSDEGAHGFSLAAKVPLGAVVATCDLMDVVPVVRGGDTIEECCVEIFDDALTLVRPHYASLWTTSDITAEAPYGDFERGRYAWLLDNVVALPEPVPAKGRQGLWNWEYTTP